MTISPYGRSYYVMVDGRGYLYADGKFYTWCDISVMGRGYFASVADAQAAIDRYRRSQKTAAAIVAERDCMLARQDSKIRAVEEETRALIPLLPEFIFGGTSSAVVDVGGKLHIKVYDTVGRNHYSYVYLTPEQAAAFFAWGSALYPITGAS